MLMGLGSETILVRTIQIRSETDPKRIKNMTAAELKIRSDWQRFKLDQHLASMSREEIEKEREERKQKEWEILNRMFK